MLGSAPLAGETKQEMFDRQVWLRPFVFTICFAGNGWPIHDTR